jgi:hypothetical protein
MRSSGTSPLITQRPNSSSSSSGSPVVRGDNGTPHEGRTLPPSLSITPSMLDVNDPVPESPKNYEDTHEKYNNRIFIELTTQNSVTYYVPTYLVVLIKRLEKYNFCEGAATACIFTVCWFRLLVLLVRQWMNFDDHGGMTLVLRIMYDPTLDPEIIQKLRNPKLRLNEDNCDIANDVELKESKYMLSFTARITREVSPSIKNALFTITYVHFYFVSYILCLFVDSWIQIRFKPNLNGFPFDLQNLDLKFELTSQSGKDSKGVAFNIRFNFHKNTNPDVMLRFKNILFPSCMSAERLQGDIHSTAIHPYL